MPLTRIVSALFKVSYCLALTLFSMLAVRAAPLDNTSSKLIPAVIPMPQCVFSYKDTYADVLPPPNGSSTTPRSPAVAAQTNIAPGSFGTPLQLSFSHYGTATAANPAPTTPPLPCDGYYLISFSIQLESSDAMNCYNGEGENAIGLCVTTSDTTAVYKDPWGYSSSAGSVYGCNGRTFTHFVQCTWGNNQIENWWSNPQYNPGGANFNWPFTTPWGYPMSIYNHWFDYGYSKHGSVAAFQDQIWRTFPPYNPFCYHQNGASSDPWYNCMQTKYRYIYYAPPPQAYCTLQPFNFNTTVFLHKGSTITAPTLTPQSIPRTAYAILPDSANVTGPANFQPRATCGIRVVGGHFSVTYMRQ